MIAIAKTLSRPRRNGSNGIHVHEQAVRHEPLPAAAGGQLSLHMFLALVSLVGMVAVAIGRELDGTWRWVGFALPVALGVLWIGGLWVLSRVAKRARESGSAVAAWTWLIPILTLAMTVVATYIVYTHSTAW